jgi:hypothetical protein
MEIMFHRRSSCSIMKAMSEPVINKVQSSIQYQEYELMDEQIAWNNSDWSMCRLDTDPQPWVKRSHVAVYLTTLIWEPKPQLSLSFDLTS